MPDPKQCVSNTLFDPESCTDNYVKCQGSVGNKLFQFLRAVRVIPTVWNKVNCGPLPCAFIERIDLEFDPRFALLKRFAIGLPPSSKTNEDVVAVAKYIGVGLSGSDLGEQIAFVTNELRLQNRFLNAELSSDSIVHSEEYRKSMFIREVVANNRENLQRRLQRKC